MCGNKQKWCFCHMSLRHMATHKLWKDQKRSKAVESLLLISCIAESLCMIQWLLLLKAYYGAETANEPMQYRFHQISHVLHIHAASMLVELYFCRASILDRKHRAGLNIHLATQRNQSITSSRRCFLKAKQVLKKYCHLMSLVNGSIACVSDIRI